LIVLFSLDYFFEKGLTGEIVFISIKSQVSGIKYPIAFFIHTAHCWCYHQRSFTVHGCWQ